MESLPSPWPSGRGSGRREGETLSRDLVEKGRRRRRCVQALDVAGHRQPQPGVAAGTDQAVHPMLLTPHHQADSLAEVELPCELLAAGVERDAPDPGALELGDRGRET